MNEQQVIDLINQWIVENHSKDITANVLNPVLLAMVQQPNLLIGDLGDLGTGENNNLVDAINWILTQISSGNIIIHTGQDNPNDTPPSSYAVADFYSQLDVMNNPLYLWQYTGTEWARISNYIDDNIEALDTTWSSHKIWEAIKGDRLNGNPIIVLDENEITISSLSWWIQGSPYILIPPFTDTIPYTSASGYSRKDIIVAVQSNNLVRIPGDEGTGIVQPPQVPPNTLLVTEFDVYHDSIGEPTEPIIGNQYIKKQSESITNINITTSPIALSIDPNARIFKIVSSVPNPVIVGFADTVLWSGADIWVWNDTDEDATMLHDSDSGLLDYPAYFSETEEDFVLKSRHKSQFKFNPANGRYEFFGVSLMSGNYLPLSGTVAGKPITGNIKVGTNTDSDISFMWDRNEPGDSFNKLFFKEYGILIVDDDNGTAIQLRPDALIFMDGYYVPTNNNQYIQKKYVDDSISALDIPENIGDLNDVENYTASNQFAVSNSEGDGVEFRKIGTDDIPDLGVTNNKLAAGAVTNEKLADNSINPAKIQNNAVTTIKINNAAVTTPKLADNNVTPEKLSGKDYLRNSFTWTAYGASNGVSANSWSSITYGNGRFVAVASTGTNRAMWSLDGKNWNAVEVEDSAWSSITYGNGRFVAVASTGTNRAMWSLDGENWNAVEVVTNVWSSIAYGNGRFVAVAGTGTNRTMWSLDGENWNAVALGTISTLNTVTYSNGKFVATATSGTYRIFSSEDGSFWTAYEAANITGGGMRRVIYAQGKYVIVNSENSACRIAISTDLDNWEVINTIHNSQKTGIWYVKGRYIVFGAGGSDNERVSLDLYSWNYFDSGATGANDQIQDLVYADGKFVAVRGAVGGADRVLVYEEPEHTSDFINDGDGESPFVTEKWVVNNERYTKTYYADLEISGNEIYDLHTTKHQFSIEPLSENEHVYLVDAMAEVILDTETNVITPTGDPPLRLGIYRGSAGAELAYNTYPNDLDTVYRWVNQMRAGSLTTPRAVELWLGTNAPITYTGSSANGVLKVRVYYKISNFEL